MKSRTTQSICQHYPDGGVGCYPIRKNTPIGKKQASVIIGICLLAQLIATSPSTAVAGGVNVAPNPPGVTAMPVQCLDYPGGSNEVTVTFCFTTYMNATPNGKKHFLSVAARVDAPPAPGTPQFFRYLESIKIYSQEGLWTGCDVRSNLMTGSSSTCSISGRRKLDQGFTVRVEMPGFVIEPHFNIYAEVP